VTKEIPEGRQGNVPEHYLRGNAVCRFNGESRLPPYALRKFFGKGYGFVRERGKWNGAPRFPFQCTGIYSRTPHPGPSADVEIAIIRYCVSDGISSALRLEKGYFEHANMQSVKRG